MATDIMEARLRTALDADRGLVKRGCSTRQLDPSGVGVSFGSAEAGAWFWANGMFELRSDGGTSVVTVETVAEAVRYTRERLGQ